MLAVECRDVCKSFTEGSWMRRGRKVNAVNQVSFGVPSGEIMGLLGTNGSGKSTLIRMLATLVLPDSGRIRVMGYNPVSHPLEVRRLINRVAVEAAFYKKLSARENLDYASRLYGLNPASNRARMAEIFERLGLKPASLEDPLQDMSRGMQQKVAIARALIAVPPILLLDEPTTGLDPVSKREVKKFIQEIRHEHQTTIILTTHDMQEADDLCDRIAIIQSGRIVALDTPDKLKSRVNQGSHTSLEEAFVALTELNQLHNHDRKEVEELVTTC